MSKEGVPLISAALSKQTLASKKKKTPKKARNILLEGKESAWTHVPRAVYPKLQSHLYDILTPCRSTGTKLIYAQIKGVPKKQRRALRKAGSSKQSLRHLLAIGCNAVIRGLEKDILMSVIYSPEMGMESVVNYISECCRAKKIPAVAYCKIPNETQQFLGFKCMCLGFKDDPKTRSINNLVQNIFNGSKPDVSTKNVSNIEESSMDCEEVCEEERSAEPKKVVEVPNLHLQRTSIMQRVFKPELHSKDDMILLEPLTRAVPEPETGTTYKRLKIKQIQPNPNRAKKKANLIKNVKKRPLLLQLTD